MPKKINGDDLWNNESVQVLIKNIHPEDLKEYRKTTSTLMANMAYINPKENVIDSAWQIRLLLRDGLPVDLLTKEEKQLFIDIYGEDELEKF